MVLKLIMRRSGCDGKARQSLIDLSRDFIELVRGSVQDRSIAQVEQSVAFWCQNQPRWYQEFVWDSLHIPPRYKLHIAAPSDAHREVMQLADKLQRTGAVCLFLLEDSGRLAEVYSSLGGEPMLVTYGRQSLPGDRLTSYFIMFSLVNRAARRANGDWRRFQKIYEAEFAALLQTNIGRAIDRSIGACLKGIRVDLRHLIASGKPLVLVDTGMQGTFSAALVAWLRQESDAAQDQIDIHLLAAYPWLGQLYQDRCISTSTAVVAAIENRFTVAA